MLLYKPDWEETQRRFAAWWAGEYFGRCALAVCAPRADAAGLQPPPVPARVEDRWLDHGYLRSWNEYQMRGTFFGGEALPVWKPGGYPGWACHPCFLGAGVTLDETTGWVHPLLNEGRLSDYDPRRLALRPDNRWWRTAREMMRLAVEESRGTSIPSIGAFGGSGDTLASLRGTEQLLHDVADCPECVCEFDLCLMRQWIEIYNTLYGIMRGEGEGSTCWCELWSPGRFYACQNDFSCMISTRTYRDVFLPSLELQTQFLDHCVFHVDGVAAFAHLDLLLELPRLQAFQIIPGAGKPSPLHYLDVLKKIQAAGRNLQLYLAADEVRTALENLSARGLFIFTSCAGEAEARALLRDCEQLSVDR